MTVTMISTALNHMLCVVRAVSTQHLFTIFAFLCVFTADDFFTMATSLAQVKVVSTVHGVPTAIEFAAEGEVVMLVWMKCTVTAVLLLTARC